MKASTWQVLRVNTKTRRLGALDLLFSPFLPGIPAAAWSRYPWRRVRALPGPGAGDTEEAWNPGHEPSRRPLGHLLLCLHVPHLYVPQRTGRERCPIIIFGLSALRQV